MSYSGWFSPNDAQREYKVFDMFNKRWGLVTAGGPDHFNTCTIGWEPHWEFIGEVVDVENKR